MRTTKLLTLTATLIMGGSMALTSCHDHDEVCSDAATENNNGNHTLTAEALENMLYVTTALDTLPSNWQSASFSVPTTYGEVTDQSTPRIRYVVATSTADAVEFFTDLTGQDEDSYTSVWSHDSIGTVTLNTDSTETCYGKVLMSVKQLTDVDEFRFVPASALGQNSGSWTARYHFGDVLKFTIPAQGKNPSRQEYWVCIRGEWNTKEGDKDYSYWACFTLGPDNIASSKIGKQTVYYPKNMGGSSNLKKIYNLPQLLYILTAPSDAWKAWDNYAKANDSKWAFLGKPVLRTDYEESDFSEIFNMWREKFGKYPTEVIPALGKNNYDEISLNHNITLICHGATCSSLWSYVGLSKCLNFTDNFYTNHKEFEFKYGISAKTGFDVRDLMKNNGEATNSSFYNAAVGLNDENEREGSYFFVRIQRSDKLPGVRKGKNNGQKFELKNGYSMEECILVPYNKRHSGNINHSLVLPSTAKPSVGDILQYKNENTPCLCVAGTGYNYVLMSYATDDVTEPEITEDFAVRTLTNVMNMYLVKDYLSSGPTKLFNQIYEIFGDDVNGCRKYCSWMADGYMHYKVNMLSNTNNTSLGELFNFQNDKDTYSVSMPCYKTENNEKIKETMTLTLTDGVYKVEIAKQNAEHPVSVGYRLRTCSNDDLENMTRIANSGSSAEEHYTMSIMVNNFIRDAKNKGYFHGSWSNK